MCKLNIETIGNEIDQVSQNLSVCEEVDADYIRGFRDGMKRAKFLYEGKKRLRPLPEILGPLRTGLETDAPQDGEKHKSDY